MKLENFNYDLPTNLIAQEPAEPRDSCRLMLVDKKTGEWEHQSFRDILNEIRAGDVLVFNNTKVIPARLYGQRKGTGGKVEMLLLSPKGNDNWEVLVKPGKKALPGTEIVFNEHMSCQIVDKTDFGGRIAHFKYNGEFDSILDQIGEMPIPPYIHKKLEDKNKYQTIYAKYKGSAAAPTAGLHFTEELLEEIKNRGAGVYFVTLHVGLGTFRPVAKENIEEHEMHKEWYDVPQITADAVNRAKTEGRRIIAVGTTSVRTLESAGQTGTLVAGGGWTQLYIYPGYEWNIVDAIVTNFHLPESTLIMMMAAFAGTNHILSAYKEAVNQKYRFFSFGDAMFLR
ncbi:tRNA preQ1(34) S-adenosylmethionine ribosyltransferase-isomerase QueA [Dialister pneumosintes]|uniref:S-adenosylmethionine:tRNA ribosyltransferase-isomerase n=1 Tax=Dialister pneumosintes TaxID=39950 RepID=A0A1B3WD51_9FIRM|nr:tRNA preQ1(34) S-adenosylmethionine ribosyltransferase-isomerase QueA [Dialister pneumosintes]AOH38883.1 tRNA preQ1(34) S-adenosylmethionine ribosyltransferase-isomerase QueA [Dialister pneumosintes]MBS6479975.1 tRNA preQ1(34) S-adenosylmethionine ribosyltransferase-isomerase QueA [Dialister sp.]RID94157.1 tRNA preQ1(34) S-adenosylmethionine ribosyltransferase-isomerase QueA [Dialister pneumosintes]CDF27148.1 s-adenosylmethionine:tRNA ribosyltransferase-isomerase [Dialister sp. CAG:588]